MIKRRRKIRGQRDIAKNKRNDGDIMRSIER